MLLLGHLHKFDREQVELVGIYDKEIDQSIHEIQWVYENEFMPLLRTKRTLLCSTTV